MAAVPSISPAAGKLGANVRAQRDEVGLTREQVAEKTGHDVGTIARVERGEVDARISTLLAIAGALDVEACEFVHGVTLDMVPTPQPRSEARKWLRSRRRPLNGA